MRFIDTNVLLYAVSTVRAERVKNRRALEILERDDLTLSVQVLQEFYVQATRPTKRLRLSHDHAVALIESKKTRWNSCATRWLQECAGRSPTGTQRSWSRRGNLEAKCF